MKITYENIEIMLTKLKYDEHGWKVCIDIKVLNMLQSQKSGYTKCPSFYVNGLAEIKLIAG